MRLMLFTAFNLLFVFSAFAQPITYCNQEVVRIERIWTGGIFGTTKDLYGPISARNQRCQQIYPRYYDFFTEFDCNQMVSNFNRNNGSQFGCSQRGEAIDLWDGKAWGNVCYACIP